MKPIKELNFAFRDAENFSRRENKELFKKIFIRTPELEKLLESNIYFLLGEKGTGKTAFATYLKNTHRTNASLGTFISDIKKISETDYPTFIALKKKNQLELSNFTTIWKVVLYFLIAQKICKDEVDDSLFSTKFKNIKQAIVEYNKGSAFSPEIINAINFVEKSSDSAQLICKFLKLNREETIEQTSTESRFQTNLFYLQNTFQDALRSTRLKSNHILFIDGIDVRPDNISYDDYLECIKGLANAVWDINTVFFANIKDSKRLRVILIMRPDIFWKLRLANLNSKISDNSVSIDWRCTYESYRNSKLFEMADRLLGAQQNTTDILDIGKAWDHYFPAKIYIKSQELYLDSFTQLLKYSLHRPRDIVAMLEILRDNFSVDSNNKNKVFTNDDLEDRKFKEKCSRYMWSEVKEHLKFYYTEKDESLFKSFFSSFRKFKFLYKEFCDSFAEFLTNVKPKDPPLFFETADAFLQLLFDLNVICYIDENGTRHYSYREKSYADDNPIVKRRMAYQLHPAFSVELHAI